MTQMKRLLLALLVGVPAAATLVTSGAPMVPAPFDGAGTLVFSCSGCPEKPSGPSLYVVRASGAGFRRLHTPLLSPYSPRWAPNGRRIVFSSRFTDIWTTDAAGVSPRRLTHACVECDSDPAWSPDGRRIVFSRDGVLFTMRADGPRERRLLGFKGQGLGSPDWSPNGRRVVFDQHGSRLYVARSNGREIRRLRRVSGRYPRWSPDGRLIAFIGFTGRGAALLVVHGDGTHPRIVARHETIEINSPPAWSPDGRHIVFAVRHEFRNGGDYDGHELLVAPLDGGPPRPIVIPELPPFAYSELHGLDWSRGSTRLR